MSVPTYNQSLTEELDYIINWATYLAGLTGTVTISSMSATGGTGLSVDSSSNTTTTTTTRISLTSSTFGKSTVKHLATLSDGQKVERCFKIRYRDSCS